MPELKQTLGVWSAAAVSIGAFRVPFYPVTPVLGIISCALLLAFLSRYAMVFGLIWLTIGIIVYERQLRYISGSE
jgi:hypothetical protein